MARALFLLFLIVPLIEIGLFIAIGGVIGLWPTLLGVVVTALIGSAVLRVQGLSLLAEIQRLMNAGRMPAQQLVEGVLLAVAGALLLTPGYFTDAVGFVLLVPTARIAIYRYLRDHVQWTGVASAGPARPEKPDVVDLDDDQWRPR